MLLQGRGEPLPEVSGRSPEIFGPYLAERKLWNAQPDAKAVVQWIRGDAV